MVECSPATRAARVRFPDVASFFFSSGSSFWNIADSRIRTGAPKGNMIVTWLLTIKSPNPSFQVFKYWLKQNLSWLINWKFVSVSITCKWTGFLNDINKNAWPRRDLNTQPSDLESDALPLRHGVLYFIWFILIVDDTHFDWKKNNTSVVSIYQPRSSQTSLEKKQWFKRAQY